MQGWRMEEATLPGAARENSSNDLEELGPRPPQRVASGLLVLGFWPLGAASTATEGSGSGDPKRLAPPIQP